MSPMVPVGGGDQEVVIACACAMERASHDRVMAWADEARLRVTRKMFRRMIKKDTKDQDRA
jgi:hypothetical protein